MRRRRITTAWLVAGLAALVAVALYLFPVATISHQSKQAIAFFRDAGPVPFFLAMAVLPAVGFPLSGFTVVAGPLFGPTMGVPQVVVCTILATSANVALSYWIALRALRPLIERLLRWSGHTLPKIKPHTAWPITLLVRIVPGPPFFLQSYLLALAKAPFGIYMVVSTLVPACYLAATIILGDALVRRDPWAMAWAGAIFLLAGAILHVLRKRFTPPRPPDQSPAPEHG